MDHIEVIKRNIIEGDYYSALFLALMIPSICGALESDNGEDDREKYQAWYNKYVPIGNFTAADCYRLRCSLLHQSSTRHKDSSWGRVMFTLPGSNTIHDCISNGALCLHLPLFLQQIISGAELWLSHMKGNANFLKYTNKMIKVHPNGIPPHIVGQLVIS